jgi:hypothetical protein
LIVRKDIGVTGTRGGRGRGRGGRGRGRKRGQGNIRKKDSCLNEMA